MSGKYATKGEATAATETKLDFSPAAIRRQVTTETAQKPYVLYPLALGILGVLATMLLEPSLFTIGVAAGGILAGLGGWLVNVTLRNQVHVSKHLAGLRRLLAERVNESIHNLKHDLSEVAAHDGLQQLKRLEDKYTTFQEMLQRKLDTDELTYDRYLGMTEQVYLAGLDNLNRIAAIMKSISAMDVSYLKSRISELREKKALKKTEESELEALVARLQLRKTQEDKVHSLLSQNEEAMTRMDTLMAALADMGPGQSRATMDMESAMQELERLAQRAQDY